MGSNAVFYAKCPFNQYYTLVHNPIKRSGKFFGVNQFHGSNRLQAEKRQVSDGIRLKGSYAVDAAFTLLDEPAVAPGVQLVTSLAGWARSIAGSTC
jgi:hypothetical protein